MPEPKSRVVVAPKWVPFPVITTGTDMLFWVPEPGVTEVTAVPGSTVEIP
jgi:hypothetical protein